MKINRISQNNPQFQDEGRNIEESPEMEQFTDKQEMNDQMLGKRGQTHTADILGTALKSIGHILNSSYVANGAVGWVKHSDGIIYEILVSPAASGQYFDHFKNLSSPKSNNIDNIDDIEDMESI